MTILEAVYSILSPIEYIRAKNRQSAKILAEGMTLQELIEQSSAPYELDDGIAEVFLDQIVERLCYHRSKNPFQK